MYSLLKCFLNIMELLQSQNLYFEFMNFFTIKNTIHKSHIFKYLHSTATCFDSYSFLCFKIIHKANSKFDLKIEEALHIT